MPLQPKRRAPAFAVLRPVAGLFLPQTVYRPGDRVGHKAFGEGLVVEAVNMGNDTLLTIAFDKVEPKSSWPISPGSKK